MPKIVERPVTEFQAEVTEDRSALTFELSNGLSLTMTEPKAMHFLKAEDFYRQLPKSEQGFNAFIIKLASLCVTPQQSYEQLLNSLEDFSDVDKLMAALDFFQDRLTEYYERLQKSSQ